jgi:hypothetical protein
MGRNALFFSVRRPMVAAMARLHTSEAGSIDWLAGPLPALESSRLLRETALARFSQFAWNILARFGDPRVRSDLASDLRI